eukprot:TRINITY_DN12428_c0_g1_i1.p1 TRINITY_DN12428_c0_g1~~TRINITY_DN12428_c0_g1_i1.p1  ORF type:complete len:51 (+),score=2.84 TRINITY_DN12428_c0_g1_i1:213-365(+)
MRYHAKSIMKILLIFIMHALLDTYTDFESSMIHIFTISCMQFYESTCDIT